MKILKISGFTKIIGAFATGCHGEKDPKLSHYYQEKVGDAKRSSGIVPEEFAADECSRRNYEGVSLEIPFVALASASLLAAGTAHQVMNNITDCNKLILDLFGKQQKLGRYSVSKVTGQQFVIP